jgi:Transposase DDE domain
MSRTSKSPLDVAKAAYMLGQKALPRYAHKFSRRDFTCAQLFAILVLRKFFKTDYRGVIQYLCEWAELREALDLHDKVPHFTTPQKAAAKLLDDAMIRKLLTQTIDAFYPRRPPEVDDDDVAWLMRIDQAAGDSTGFESGHCSRYFTRRRGRGGGKKTPETYPHFPKLGVVIDCANHLILCALRGLGPAPDAGDLRPMLTQMPGNILFDQMLLDAGYDSEANHMLLREGLGIESVIPAKAGHPTDQLPRGKWRWLMATHFNTEDYGQRWQVETVMRMIKARQGESMTARSDATRRDELGLMAVTHNVMIILCAWARAFLQSMFIPVT